MKLVEVRDLRKRTTPQIRKQLEAELEIILTAGGRPFAMMTRVSPGTVDREVKALRRARAQMVVDEIRAQAKATGADKLTMRQIDEIIAKVRAERRAEEEKPKTRKGTTAKPAK